MKPSRREFLHTAALVAGSLPIGRHLAALGARSSSPSSIRKMLAAKRATIKTLHVDYQYRNSPPADVTFDGRHQMFFSHGRYHYRISLASEEGELITIVRDNEVLAATIAAGIVKELRVRERTPRDPEMSVGKFLPVPADQPMTPRGRRTLGGQECLGILQGSDCYWVDLGLGVVRALDKFGSEKWVKHALTFESFVQLSETLHFPRLLKLHSFAASGRMVSETVGEVTTATLNEPLAEDLFTIASFPKPGEKVTLE